MQSLVLTGFFRDPLQIESLSNNDIVDINHMQINGNGKVAGAFDQATSGIRFDAVPRGATGRLSIMENVIFDNGLDGIDIESVAAPAAPSSTTSLIMDNVIGYGSGFTLFSNGRAAITLGNGAANIDVLENDIYNANGSAVRVTSTARNQLRFSDDITNAVKKNRVLADLANNPGAAVPFDLLADGLQNQNDAGDADTGPNGLQNSPEIQVRKVLKDASAWTIPVRLDSQPGDYYLDIYIQDAGSGRWDFYSQQTSTFSSSTTEVNIVILNSVVQSGSKIGIVATGKTVNVNNSSEFVTFGLTARVNDVKLTRTAATGISPWVHPAYSLADRVEQRRLLVPIATAGANSLSITFNQDIRKSISSTQSGAIGSGATEGNALLKLFRTQANGSQVLNARVLCEDFSYDAATRTATWRFAPLTNGKYEIELLSGFAGGIVTDTAAALDGDFEYLDNSTPDKQSDDPVQAFKVGDGTAGSPNVGDQFNTVFRMLFALQAGDYNGDGLVNSADIPQSGNLDTDGNGDGLVDLNAPTSADYAVRDANINSFLPLMQFVGADFKDDEIVGTPDLSQWKVATTSTDPLIIPRGDANADSLADGNDLLKWMSALGNWSYWNKNPPNSPAASANENLILGLPKVANVIVSGSHSTHSPYSFDSVDGSGLQLRTVPVGGADTVSIVFTEGVNLTATSLIMVGLGTANVPRLANFSYDSATFTATWRFDGWATGDQYYLALSDEITDSDGYQLDGEWTNPASISTVNASVSTFPSGNGYPGGWFKFILTLLPGDANLDGVVSIADFSILSNSWGMSPTLFASGDFSGDGTTNTTDLNFLVNNWNVNRQTVQLLADFDGDFDVDDTDLTVIADHAGMTGATHATGDLNGDGLVTMADLDLAFAQYGVKLNLAS